MGEEKSVTIDIITEPDMGELIPLLIHNQDGKEIMRLDINGKIHVDPNNVDDAAKAFVNAVEHQARNIPWHTFGNPFGRAAVAELVEVLGKLIDASESFHDAATAYFTDSTYDGDGILADSEATLSVSALPDAKALLSRHQAGLGKGVDRG